MWIYPFACSVNVFVINVFVEGDCSGPMNGQTFTTKDADHDTSPTLSCSQQYKGGWWYSWCYCANLNGLYLQSPYTQNSTGIVWGKWKGYTYSLKSVTMKIRRN